jgi:hypothetical protein
MLYFQILPAHQSSDECVILYTRTAEGLKRRYDYGGPSRLDRSCGCMLQKLGSLEDTSLRLDRDNPEHFSSRLQVSSQPGPWNPNLMQLVVIADKSTLKLGSGQVNRGFLVFGTASICANARAHSARNGGPALVIAHDASGRELAEEEFRQALRQNVSRCSPIGCWMLQFHLQFVSSCAERKHEGQNLVERNTLGEYVSHS